MRPNEYFVSLHRMHVDMKDGNDYHYYWRFDGGEPLMRSTVVVLTLFAIGCATATPEAQNVRVTNNPDVVRGCEFLGNVKAMSGWGGSAGGGLAARNIEETLKQRTHALGGNVVYVIGNENSRGSGEAYRCAVTQP